MVAHMISVASSDGSTLSIDGTELSHDTTTLSIDGTELSHDTTSLSLDAMTLSVDETPLPSEHNPYSDSEQQYHEARANTPELNYKTAVFPSEYHVPFDVNLPEDDCRSASDPLLPGGPPLWVPSMFGVAGNVKTAPTPFDDGLDSSDRSSLEESYRSIAARTRKLATDGSNCAAWGVRVMKLFDDLGLWPLIVGNKIYEPVSYFIYLLAGHSFYEGTRKTQNTKAGLLTTWRELFQGINIDKFRTLVFERWVNVTFRSSYPRFSRQLEQATKEVIFMGFTVDPAHLYERLRAPLFRRDVYMRLRIPRSLINVRTERMVSKYDAKIKGRPSLKEFFAFTATQFNHIAISK